jgi:UDP-N-acetylglucosamine 2-epimerase (non-hydrolysing)/UDP-GlcNAc3NAcA epimerase
MTGPERHVVTVVGNRPQFVKAAAVSAHLRERLRETLVHTGQHYDPELSDVFFEQLEMPAPDRELGIGSGSHAEQTAAILARLEPLVTELEPDGVLVYGDTNSTLGGALVAAKASVPLVHVEAGMRSGNRAMPEEINRLVVDSLGGLLLCSTETAAQNLLAEGRGSEALVTGDVMADVALAFGPIADERSDVLERLGLEPRAFGVATAHRPGNVDDADRLALLVDVLARAAEEAPLVFPVHPRTRARLEEMGALAGLAERGITPVEPLGYLDMTRLVRAARLVLTDSGGLQKEAFLASVPCLTMREETEWLETTESGWNRLIGLRPDAVTGALAELPAPGDTSPAADIYGAGKAGERVAEAVADWLA